MWFFKNHYNTPMKSPFVMCFRVTRSRLISSIFLFTVLQHERLYSFFEVISDFCVDEGPTVLLGDFNFPDIRWFDEPHDPSSLSKGLFDLCISHNFQQFVTSPTRSSPFLDLLFSNQSQLVSEVHAMAPIGSSDYAAVSFSLSFPRGLSWISMSRILALQTVKLLRGTLLAMTGLTARIQ